MTTDAPLRWIKFWPQDWISDKALRVCSPAARGTWMDLICVMHDAQPYGHLAINGRAATPRQIGALVGVTEKEAMRLISELEEAGVCSRDDNGMLYSRRMVRDKAARDVGKEMGKLGGNPKLKSRLAGGLTPPLTPPVNPEANYGVKHLEAEAEKKESKKDTLLRSDACASQNVRMNARDDFWQNGLKRVSAMTGKPERALRSVMGKWAKDAKDDCAMLNAIIADCEGVRPGDALAWIAAGITARMKPPDKFAWLDQPMTTEAPLFDLEMTRDEHGTFNSH